jgi:hypothetical protein
MQTKISLEYVGQKSDEVPEEWHNKACGIAAVKMILSKFGDDSPDIKSLIDEGVSIGGYSEVGWDHQALVRLLRNHGVTAYAQEFKSNNQQLLEKFTEKGLEKISNVLQNSLPVIASVEAGFDSNDNSHMILFTGIEKDENGEVAGFFYNDPDNRDGADRADKFVDMETFQKFWRKFAIFVE